MEESKGIIKELEKKFPLSSEIISGLTVLKNVPGEREIDEEIKKYFKLRNIREAKLSYFKINEEKDSYILGILTEAVKKRKKVAPLIIVVDADKDYIFLDQIMLNVFKALGIDKFPAIVIIDKNNEKYKNLDDVSVYCSWCGKLIYGSNKNRKECSHGMCKSCLEKNLIMLNNKGGSNINNE